MRAVSLALLLVSCSSRPPAFHRDPHALAWRSRSRVPDAAARQIAAEALEDAGRRPAWREPNHVHVADGPIGDRADKFLFGEARLYVGEYEPVPGKFREVDPRDDAMMAYADALQTVEQLQRWSRAHGVSWDVRLGDRAGGVDASGPDAGGRKLLAELSSRAGADAVRARNERPRIESKYRDRR